MENNLSKEIYWFLDTLKNDFGLEVEANDIGIEATELGIDEVEDFFVPTEVLSQLPTSLLYEIMIVDDAEENVWVGAIAFHPNSVEWCLQVITKNDEVVLRNALSLPL